MVRESVDLLAALGRAGYLRGPCDEPFSLEVHARDREWFHGRREFREQFSPDAQYSPELPYFA